jgi:hypothetical protein
VAFEEPLDQRYVRANLSRTIVGAKSDARLAFQNQSGNIFVRQGTMV